MAHRLAMDKVHAITSLHSQGMSERQIARPWRSVAKQFADIWAARRQRIPKRPPGKRPPGRLTQRKPRTAAGSTNDGTAGITRPSRSDCEDFRQLIIDKLEEGLTAQRIFQDLQEEHGFSGKYSSVRRFVHKLGQGTELPVRRIRSKRDTKLQVDYGTGEPLPRSIKVSTVKLMSSASCSAIPAKGIPKPSDG